LGEGREKGGTIIDVTGRTNKHVARVLSYSENDSVRMR
jgi:hypothetical protein